MTIPPNTYKVLVPNGTQSDDHCVPTSIALGEVESVACRTKNISENMKYNVQFKRHEDGPVYAILRRKGWQMGDVETVSAEKIIFESNYSSSYNKQLSNYTIEEQTNIVKAVANKDKLIEVALEKSSSSLPNKIYIHNKGWIYN